MPWTRNSERPWADNSGREWSADDIATSINRYFGYMSNQGFSRGSIDRRDNARFTPQDATEYCWGQNFPIGQYVRELSAGVDEHDLSRPERDALWRAELRFAQDAYSMYLYDPSGRPGPEGAPRNFDFGAPGRDLDDHEVYLVDAYGQEADWPDTPPLPEYSASGPAAHNDPLPAYARDRRQDPQSNTPWQAPDLPPAYTPPQQPPAPAQPANAGVARAAHLAAPAQPAANADVARAASAGQEQRATANEQAPRRRSARIQSRNAAAQAVPQQNTQSRRAGNGRRSR
ncbi:hypothetical protein RKD37_000233 [Streptomyces ambofaciens]